MIKCLLNNQILNEYVPNKSSFNKWLYAIDFKKDAELNIKIVNPEEMRNYNKIYRNINKVSDTLAFPTEIHVIENKVILGDIVMCANKINESLSTAVFRCKARHFLEMPFNLKYVASCTFIS